MHPGLRNGRKRECHSYRRQLYDGSGRCGMVEGLRGHLQEGNEDLGSRGWLECEGEGCDDEDLNLQYTVSLKLLLLPNLW